MNNKDSYIIDDNTENNCKVISDRGVIKSFNYVFSLNNISPNIYNLKDNEMELINILPNSIIYIFTDAITYFVDNIFDKIKNSFILVSGHSDLIVPTDVFNDINKLINFINSPKIIHWFCQNYCNIKHKKISGIPIGINFYNNFVYNYKSIHPVEEDILLNNIYKKSLHFYDRFMNKINNNDFKLCYSNFITNLITGDGGRFGKIDRNDALKNIPKELIHYEPKLVYRETSWNNQIQYPFIVSPHGNGLDCNRTWEALSLGCIVIVKKSYIDHLYKNLPVLIVNEWKDITYELLLSTIKEYKTKEFKLEKLTLKYWINIIKSYK